MKLWGLAIPVIAIAAAVLLGGAVAGLVTARAVLASEPTPTATPVPLKLPEVLAQPPASPTKRSTKGAGSVREGSGQGTVYTWEDGDRTLRVVLQADLVAQETASNTPEDVVVAKGAGDSIVQKQAKHGQDARPVFRLESGGGLLMLPGGVLLALDPEWDRARVESFFSRNDISTDRTSELGFLENGFLVDTEPGFPSLELANALATQDGVVISSPNWWREVGTQSADDHGNAFNTATDLSLGSSVTGRIDPDDDRDFFKLDLSGASGPTDVWIYTTGDLDTVGELLDSNRERLALNDDLVADREHGFHIRAVLSVGVYYVAVRSDGTEIGDYTLHARTVTDPGSTTGTATRLNFDSATTGTIGTAGDADYFRLDLAESTNLVLQVKSGSLTPIDGLILDSGGAEIPVNVYPVPKLVQPIHDRIGFRIEDDFDPGTYYVKVTAPDGVASHPVPYTILAFEDTAYPTFVEECETRTLSLNDPQISDPLYGCQWHLNNRDGEDINVEAVWAEGVKGEGINVAVVDDGMYFTHEDLRDNVDASRNHDYTGSGDIHHPLEHHGTNVAGVIAARDNGIGVRGVAPRATIYGYNFLADSTFLNGADAMTRNGDVTAVSNNSWGPRRGPGLGHANSFWELAVNAGITAGYDGKGTFYVFSGGNGHLLGDDSNLDELANYFGVTAVCSVNDHDTRSDYSEMGANLWVCGPSGDRRHGYQGIVTTENNDRYDDYFSGTSAATPVVSGVAALLREANPNLTWRDLKLILAATARKNDAGNPDWEYGARKYGSVSGADRYQFNHEYGFGVVDAKAAVDLAKGWSNLPPLESSTAESGRLDVWIPDAPDTGDPATVTRTLTVGTGIEFTEFVEVTVSFQHPSFRDLQIELESPSGHVSELAVPFDTYSDDDPSLDFVPLGGTFRFGSARHLGENPNGVWKLRVTDRIRIDGGILDSWGVTVYGHGRRPGPPTVDSVMAGAGSLTVAWTAPSQTAGLAVTAYDLRHIQTVVDETVDLNWTLVEDVWTAAAGGGLEYVITALVGSAQYDVEVRAVSGARTGPWSTTVTGTPERVTTSACTTGGAVPNAANNPGLVSNCNALLSARDALAGSATLNWSASTPIVDWDGVTVAGTPQRVTELNLSDNQLTGAIPTELGRLPNLQVLILSQNQLTGPIPAWLGNLANLQGLSLWGNRLAGPIPASLGSLTNLQGLILSQNQLTGPIPVSLGDLPSLEWLYLSQNQLTGAIPASLGDLANLERLYLWGNQLVGAVPSELRSLTNLRQLRLSQNQLSGAVPTWLGVLDKLEGLTLSSNRLTGPIPASLGDLDKLQLLYLWGNQLTGPIPASLGDLDKLEELSLSSNRLAGPIPASLGSLTNLQVLILSQNQLTGPIPTELGSLTNLQELRLSQNQLAGPIPTELGNLINLQELYLFYNQLTGAIPTELGRLTNLQELYLWGNQLTGAIPASLGSLTNLQALYLSQNLLTECIPEGLRGVASNDLEDLDLPFCDVLLSGLNISPGTLTPPFDAYHSEYATVVGTSRVTVILSNEHNATLQFLDENRGEVADADASLDGHQIDVGAGITTFSIRVISQDGRATLIYTIQVNRANTPGTPVISAITPGRGSLSVSWTAPRDNGGANITSYDLRYIESDAPNKANDKWFLMDDGWTSGPLSYTITGLTGGTQYDVQVRAVNAVGDGHWSNKMSATPMVNELPVFAEGATTTRSIAEGSTEGTNIGRPIAASDADDNILAYTLGGPDAASFVIDSGTGQLMTKAELDYETKASYTVEVTATDSAGGSDTITVTINVTKVDEPDIPHDTNNDGVIDKSEMIEAFRAYIAGDIDKAQIISSFRRYIADAAG